MLIAEDPALSKRVYSLIEPIHVIMYSVNVLLSAFRLAASIMLKYSFHLRIGSLKDYYSFKKIGGRIKREVHEQLTSDPNVSMCYMSAMVFTYNCVIFYAQILWSEIQIAKKRVKRDLVQYKEDEPFSDPLYSKQWYLVRRRRSARLKCQLANDGNGVGASNGFDMKVRKVWEMGITGKGVVVSILDDGVQAAHPDLTDNYDPLASKDINDNDDDPTPQNNGDNKHGTRCAGEVSAVAGNNWCGVGVAFNSKIGGVRMLDGPVTDRVEASALSHNQNHIDIYSASWGPEDDGRAVDGPGSLAKAAFYHGITKGRGGKGNIFVWASGNGGIYGDSCSCDGYTTSIYTLSVSSATSNNERPYYLEECPSTFTTTYSSGSAFEPAIVSISRDSQVVFSFSRCLQISGLFDTSFHAVHSYTAY
ncbi:unnamed protein product [Soboliphyme baturini]|uniref:Peptidase_S8 domain-containing protein n=1 Tax=Soboliphyme baturini TaxID=241478 RepID=A0A183IIN4_9BILA|nr:unnamed protein product [Soboliphyme baturini]